MAQMLRNKFVKPKAGLNFSRSLFPYEKRHSTNLLSGYITPVHTQLLYPGDSPDWNFGCILESAPLISTNFDNIYVDVVSIWTPIRLVFEQWNEFLGESNSTAFTINRTIHIPKTYQVENGKDYLGNVLSRAYWAEHYLAGHFGMRFHGYWSSQRQTTPYKVEAGSLFETGISVLPSRIYDLNWNTFFRNENIQTPILFSKGAFNGAGRDAHYFYGLGKMQIANKLKTWYTVATPAPSLLDVSIALDQILAPVGFVPTATATTSYGQGASLPVGSSVVDDTFFPLKMSGNTNQTGVTGTNVVADLSALTVNRMYYALMEQRFANKMMKGRRMVEFYANFFGVQDSDAGHDLPQLLVQKRFPLNISQVIATAAGTDGNNKTDLGQKGAYSVTGFGGSLVKNFMASEHGYIQTYLIIRGQPSIASGIDKHLGYYSLLDFYLPEFDHIGPVGIERLELSEPDFDQYPGLYFGYTNAWYSERKPVSDCVGIIEPGQPMSYKTLALDYSTVSQLVISDAYLRHIPTIIDRVFLYPVCFGTPGTGVGTYDEFGEPYDSNRYQFITQFVVKGNTAKVMSPDSEPLMLRL